MLHQIEAFAADLYGINAVPDVKVPIHGQAVGIHCNDYQNFEKLVDSLCPIPVPCKKPARNRILRKILCKLHEDVKKWSLSLEQDLKTLKCVP